MAEEKSNAQSTQQQDGAGEAKTDAQIAADQKGAQGDGKQGGADGKSGDQSAGAGAGDGKTGDGKTDGKLAAGTDDAAGKGDGGDKKDGKSAAPEKYDLRLSDGSLLDSKTVDKIAAIAREQGLSNEDAQAHLKAIETQALTERNERVTEWNEALKTDKELGGKHFAATSQSVKRYMGFLEKEYPALHGMLERTGYTSNPDVARFLRDQGNRMAEDKHVQGGSGEGKKEKPPIENRLFPKSPKASEAT